MSEKVITKGIRFVPANALSKEATAKLNKLMEKKKESLNKLVSEYNSEKHSLQK